MPQEIEEDPARARHYFPSRELLEIADGTIRVKQEDGRIILENRCYLKEREAFAGVEQRGDALALPDLGLARGDTLVDERIRPSRHEGDIKPGLAKPTARLGLKQASMLRLRHPVELNDNRNEGWRGSGVGRGARGGGVRL